MSLTVSQILATLQDSEKLDMLPSNELSNYLLVLSSHIYIAGANITEAEGKYAEKWIELRKDAKTDREVNVAIKTYPDYKSLKSAEYALQSLLETIKAVKKVLSVKEEEARNQQ